MEVETSMWSPTPSVVSTTDSEEEMQEVWVEEIILEEDGSPAKRWNVDDILTVTPPVAVTSLDDTALSSATALSRDVSLSPDDVTAQSPLYTLPDLLTEEEDCLLEESFELMEDLILKKESFEWKDGFEVEGGVAEKAQALLDHLDEYIKKEPFSDWLEEKTELPLIEELGSYASDRAPSCVPTDSAAFPYGPRPAHLPTPHVGQIAPDPRSSGLALLTSDGGDDLAGLSAHVPDLSAPSSTPALIREFETVLHQTLTPPHTPPTYIDLVNDQGEESKSNNLDEEELDALVNSQVESLYDQKNRGEEWTPVPTADSPADEWGSVSTPVTAEDSDSACQSSSESDPDWAPSVAPSRSATGRNRRAVSSLDERKLRKKEQNKNAATRYRQKKKAEQVGILGEESGLLETNVALKEKATELQREIKYLKSLMKDICKAKGLIQ